MVANLQVTDVKSISKIARLTFCEAETSQSNFNVNTAKTTSEGI